MKASSRLRLRFALPAGATVLAVLMVLGLAPEPAAAKAATGPQLLTIQTVPRIAGVRFLVNGHLIRSDGLGVAKVIMPDRGTYPLEMLPYTGTGVRVRFARWLDDSFSPRRTVVIPNKKFLQVGLDVDYKIDFSFTDLTGAPVAASRIRTITMKSSKGSSITLARGVTSGWFSASRVIRRRVGLQSTDVVWGAETLIVDGDNAVNRGQQRFLALRGAHWTIVLQLHSAVFFVRDAFFGNAVGSALTLFLPDGSKMTVPLENGRATVHSLARGSYYVKAIAHGFSPRRPLELSKEQNVQLIVITYADIGLVLCLFLLFAGGLLMLGLRLRRKRVRIVPPVPARVPALATVGAPPIEPAPAIRLPERRIPQELSPPARPAKEAPAPPPAAPPPRPDGTPQRDVPSPTPPSPLAKTEADTPQKPVTAEPAEPRPAPRIQSSERKKELEPVAQTPAETLQDSAASDGTETGSPNLREPSKMIDLREPVKAPEEAPGESEETVEVVPPANIAQISPRAAARARQPATLEAEKQAKPNGRPSPATDAAKRPRRTPWNPWGLKLETLEERQGSDGTKSSAQAQPQAEGDGPH